MLDDLAIKNLVDSIITYIYKYGEKITQKIKIKSGQYAGVGCNYTDISQTYWTGELSEKNPYKKIVTISDHIYLSDYLCTGCYFSIKLIKE